MTSEEKSHDTPPSGKEVQDLLGLHGIQRTYINYAGEELEIPHSNRMSVLGLMGIKPGSVGNVVDHLKDYYDSALGSWLPKASIVPANSDSPLVLHFSGTELESVIEWLITTESGELLSGAFEPQELPESDRVQTPTGLFSRRLLSLPPLPAGYHDISLKGKDKQQEFQLIAAPACGFIPDWAESDRKLAGISLHLYELRSSRNWGIGDFSDLLSFINGVADSNLDFIVLNPLHILDGLSPEHCSPYSPLDRRFLNPLYIDVEKVEEFTDNPGIREYVAAAAFQDRLREMRNVDLVDYESVNHIKHNVLSKMFRQFRRQHLDVHTDRAREFLDWLAGKGASLREFGEFQASRSRLSMHMAREADYHYYLQWLAEKQLAGCQAATRNKGMAIGLIRDLAVGSRRDGAEVHLNPDLFCTAASIGAPPDPLAPQGQNWGLPPMDPVILKKSGYSHFIELLRDNMSHCGALRIDHIMSLMRLWWCPGQDHSGTGAYVAYPAKELFAILRLESQRQQCVVIGEDLGIVPPEIRQLMRESAIFSNLLFYFEKYDPVHFRHPSDWNRPALAMVANHDVPTLAAWWSKSDLLLRNEIGLFDSPDQLSSAISARESDLIQILHWLNMLDLLPASWKDFNIHHNFDASLCQAILQAVAMSEAQLVSVQPEDLLMIHKPINIPGTSDEYPNWKRKLPVSVDELFFDPGRKNLLQAFVTARGLQ